MNWVITNKLREWAGEIRTSLAHGGALASPPAFAARKEQMLEIVHRIVRRQICAHPANWCHGALLS